MKTVFFIAALSGFVAAQSAADIPSCATQCLADALSAAGCSPEDQACSCGDARPAITESATPCVLDACSIDEALMVQTITDEICANLPAEGASSAMESSAMQSSMAESSAMESSMMMTETGGAVPTASPTGDDDSTPSLTASGPETAQSTGAAPTNFFDAGLMAGALAVGAALL